MEGIVTGGDGGSSPMLQLDMPGVSTSVFLSGTQAGFLVIDEQTGWIVEQELETTTEGEVILDDRSSGMGRLSIPLSGVTVSVVR